MRYLGVPDFDAVDVFEQTLGRMKSGNLLSRMRASMIEIAENDIRYSNAAQQALSCEPDFTLSGVKNGEMATHYNTRFARLGSAGRPTYDRLKLEAGGRCPFCGHRPPATLDHYLPKERHGALAVNPSNLVAACRDCNSVKASHHPADRVQELLHPYFDDFSDVTWLCADVVRTEAGCAVTFAARPAPGMSALDASRVTHHFERLRLGPDYAALAANELAGVLHQFRVLVVAAGPAAVADELRDRAVSWAARERNCWQTALYRALADSADYHADPFA
ncbi:HNH endonuclease [Nocardioides jejuensis]|uniref:HNH nuclease domain-containing protein n=1 Tax=Nocardioides jejuensis TaxID=2502782 RepID=A0A4R1BUR0_9ACTN|nr:HNH endonuclease [Nocardioides jejuensis]TCJ21670.1 hypothetical protein EPD65_14680 [Nocardioides jejuensis]